MNKYIKFLAHFLLYIIITLIAYIIVTKLSDSYANQLAIEQSAKETGDGPGLGIFAFGLVMIINIFIFVPLISSAVYYTVVNILKRSFKKLNILFSQQVIIVFLVSLFLCGGYLIIENIQINNELNQFYSEQQQLQNQDENLFQELNITQSSPTEVQSNLMTQNNLAGFGLIFSMVITLIYATLNSVWLLIYEGIIKLVRKIKKKH